MYGLGTILTKSGSDFKMNIFSLLCLSSVGRKGRLGQLSLRPRATGATPKNLVDVTDYVRCDVYN